ncbi:MAG: methanethiol S-methyltransferase [Halioglobus sp.]
MQSESESTTQATTGPTGLAILTYGITSYLVFFASFLYAIGFIGGFGVPKTLDGPREIGLTSALLTNLGLLLLFALQHSIMARPAFKRWWTNIIHPAAERSTYVLLSSLALIAVFIWWQPLGGSIWQIENPIARTAMYTGFGCGWAMVLWSTFLINHFDLFGLRQVWLAFKHQPYSELSFVMPWLYSIIRHPLYFGWLMVLWFTPEMSAAHLLFAVVASAYIFVGIHLEERDLRVAHAGYAQYQSEVPMIVPRIGKRAKPFTDERITGEAV